MLYSLAISTFNYLSDDLSLDSKVEFNAKSCFCRNNVHANLKKGDNSRFIIVFFVNFWIFKEVSLFIYKVKT